MVKINFITHNMAVEVEKGTTILEAARKAGITIESPCNAAGTCGKCKVKVANKSLENILQNGQHHLSAEEKALGFVLSCQAKVIGNVDVEIPSKNSTKTLKILSYGQSFDIEIDGFITKEFKTDGKTYVYAVDKVIAVEDNDTTAFKYGVVVDIGTTTLVASLVDMNSGEELFSVSALNPQSIIAQDVLSRIKYASTEDGLEEMYSGIIDKLNDMIKEIVNETGIKKKYIYETIFSGNTCMIHLAANVSPYSLGKYPYTPVLKGGSHLSASEHNLDIAENGLIYLPPIISSYVGPDITSGILATRLQDKKGTSIFIDIGTNGEMVIARDGKLSSASTAAGPAFEGMNISYGMRAEKGAVEYFNIEDDDSIKIKTIQDEEPVGICGSGLLDIVGELVSHKVIGKNGRFVSPESLDLPLMLRERLVKKDGKDAFEVAEDIFLTQKDVRQVQLAKGAVRAGIEFLMSSLDVDSNSVDRVLIAGSFGYHLRAKSLINLGLLPKEFDGKIEFVGNTSKSGGHAFLLNKNYRSEMTDLVGQIEVIELANGENFDKIFLKSLSF